MKILAFHGSPRRGGNTETLLNEALRGGREAGAEITLYHLNALRIRPCQACGACDNTGRCVMQDDMQEIHAAIRGADRIVVASPIYFYSVSGQVKIMIDRCQAFWAEKYVHKRPIAPGPFGRKGLLLLVGGMKLNERNAGFTCAEASVRSFFRTVNVQEHVTLAYDHVDKKGDIEKHASAMREAYEAGIKLAAK